MMMAPGGVNWTGLYLGVNLGGGWGESRFNFAPAGTATNNFNVKGPFGGGTLGFNWQLSPAWVIGIEGDIDGTGLGGNSVCPGGGGPTNAATCRTSETFAGTARGRIGWAPGSGNLLWFATGGAAFGDINAAIDGPQKLRASTTNVGWTVGGGAEYMFAPGWSTKLEYRHTDLGSFNFNCPVGPCVAAQNTKVKLDDNNAILVGLNFHFGAPPPPPPPIQAVTPPPPPPRVFIVFFDWDRDTITPDGMAIIKQAADAYRSGAPVQIQVTGYTDRSGSAGYNQRLSERRANNVAKAMAGLGVPPTQMAVSGRGENDNRVPTADGVREPQNRRVEIVAP